MKFVATSVLIAVACFFVVAEAQKQPKIEPTQSPIKPPITPPPIKPPPIKPPIDPTALPADTPKPTKFPPVTQTTLKPTTTCNCGPTTLTSFSSSKSTTGRTTTPKPSKPWPSVDPICVQFEKPDIYYKLCKPPGSHTLNLFQNFTWGTGCFPGYPISSTVNKTDVANILQFHNNYRQKVATGRETLGNPAGPQPPASNMRETKWDDELACTAAAWARQCVYQNDQCRDVPRFRVGQNIFVAGSSDDTLDTPNWNATITSWYSEVKNMNATFVSSFPACPSVAIGRYTQVAWANSYLVGCATAYYQSTAVFGPKMPYNRIYICNYGPTGNVIGSPVYAQGRPATACPSNTKTSTAYPGLCA